MRDKGEFVIRGSLPVWPAIVLGCATGLGALAPPAAAQEDVSAPAGRPSWIIVPSVAGSLTFTDNARPGQGLKQSDQIASITPAIRIDGRGGRVSGSLNFSWQQNFYANESRYDNDQKSLSASGKAELVDQWLFLDAGAHIAQNPSSVFATQTVGNELVNDNRTQTSSYHWSPYLQGYLAGNMAYELRYRNTQTTANTGIYATGSGVDSQVWTGRLSGGTPLALLGWSLSAEDQRTRFAIRDTRSSRVFGTLEYRIDPQFKVNVSAGQESDNYSSVDLQNRGTHGYGFDWAPTERTKLSLKKEKRGFGEGHNLSFEHRTALTAWKLVDSRNVVVPAQQFATAPVSSAYEQLYALLGNDPDLRNDPVARALRTREILAGLGIPANSLYGNLLTSQPFIQRQQQASVSLIGVNNTVTFTAQRSSNTRSGTVTGLPADDFLNSQNIRQAGLSGSWAHKLTPHSALTLNALGSRSRGDLATQDTRLRSLSLLYTTRLGIRTTASLGVRQNNFDNSAATVSDYTENAVTATLSASF